MPKKEGTNCQWQLEKREKQQQVTWKCPGVTGSQVSQAIISFPWHL